MKKIYCTVVFEEAPKYCRNKHMVTLYDRNGKKIEDGIFYRNFGLNRSQKKLLEELLGMEEE